MPTLSRIGALGHKSVEGSGGTPSSIQGLTAWFDPNYGVYSDAGTTLAAVGDPVYRWVSRHNSTVYAEQTTLASRPILRAGTNGQRYLEFDGVNDILLVSQSLTYGTLFVGVQRRSGDGAYGRVLGVTNPAGDFLMYTFGYMAADGSAPHLFIRNEDKSQEFNITYSSGTVFNWAEISVTYAGSGQTNKARKRGESGYTIGGATAASNSEWSIGGCATARGKINVQNLIRYSVVLTDAQRAQMENYIYSKVPT